MKSHVSTASGQGQNSCEFRYDSFADPRRQVIQRASILFFVDALPRLHWPKSRIHTISCRRPAPPRRQRNLSRIVAHLSLRTFLKKQLRLPRGVVGKMSRIIRLIACGVLVVTDVVGAFGQNTPAPPDWRDGHGASVYLQTNQSPAMTTKANMPSSPVPVQEPEAFPAPSATPPAPIPSRQPMPVQQAAHQEPISAPPVPSRFLAPPSVREEKGSTAHGPTASGGRQLVNFGLPVQSMYTVVTALAIVIGSFLLFTWALKRGGKTSASKRTLLPADAVSILGRMPLAARQFAQLLRVGNKLVLVAFTPTGPITLTEVTDPVEVDRLTGLCQQSDPRSTTTTFDKIFQQFSQEPASGFLGEETLPTTLSPIASAYRSQRGTARA